jgi:hypothetical protein
MVSLKPIIFAQVLYARDYLQICRHMKPRNFLTLQRNYVINMPRKPKQARTQRGQVIRLVYKPQIVL